MPPWSWMPAPAAFRYASVTYALAIEAASAASGAFPSTAHAAWHGSDLACSPLVGFGTRKRLVPSSGVGPSLVRATTTSASARCASSTKSFVPFSTNPPLLSRALHVTPAASQRALGSVQASVVLARPDAI